MKKHFYLIIIGLGLFSGFLLVPNVIYAGCDEDCTAFCRNSYNPSIGQVVYGYCYSGDFCAELGAPGRSGGVCNFNCREFPPRSGYSNNCYCFTQMNCPADKTCGVSGCENQGVICGDGEIGGDEDCDGLKLGYETCASQGQIPGPGLECIPVGSPNACHFDYSGCIGAGCNSNGACDTICPSGCSVYQDPDCGCRRGDGCCGLGCSYALDDDCVAGSCTPDGCNNKCPAGCTLAEDPDCGCSMAANSCCPTNKACDPTTDTDCINGTDGDGTDGDGTDGDGTDGDGTTEGTFNIENPINADSFEAIINGLINFIFKIAIVVAPLMIVIGGFLFMTSAGDVQKVATARRLITWAAIGFIIVLLAKAVMSMLESLLEVK
jgi:hypothetical protein